MSKRNKSNTRTILIEGIPNETVNQFKVILLSKNFNAKPWDRITMRSVLLGLLETYVKEHKHEAEEFIANIKKKEGNDVNTAGVVHPAGDVDAL